MVNRRLIPLRAGCRGQRAALAFVPLTCHALQAGMLNITAGSSRVALYIVTMHDRHNFPLRVTIDRALGCRLTKTKEPPDLRASSGASY